MDTDFTSEEPQIPAPIELQPHNYMTLLLERYDNFIFDMDGTMWLEDGLTPVEGFKRTYELLKDMGKNVFFITNGAHLTRAQLVEKITKVNGVKGVRKEDVLSSGYMMARYLKAKLKSREKAYVMCDHGLKEELEMAGVRFFGFHGDTSVIEPYETSEAEIASYRIHEDVKAVVCALDPFFNTAKIFKAASYLANPDVEFLTTEISTGYSPYPKFQMWSTGSIVATVSAASGGRTPTVIGKPNMFLFDDLCSEHLGIERTKTVIIGDSLTSDIGFAKNNGISSCLVLTGCTNRRHLRKINDDIFLLNSLRESQKGLKCHIGDDSDSSRAAPDSIGPVPDFVVESAGHFGKWTPAGSWDKKVKKEKKKEEKRKLLRGGDDPTVGMNQLPFDERERARFSLAAFSDLWQLYVITGGPGSGKGTQGRLLAARYGFTHLSGGELLRSEIAQQTERGQRFIHLLQTKGEVGIFEGLEMVRDYMLSAAMEGARGFLIDGNPKDGAQAEMFEKFIGSTSGVISLSVSDGERMKRLLKRGKTSGAYRDDDNKKTIEKRLKKFHAKKGPVLKYFDDRGKLAYINGEGSVEEVNKAMVKQMDKWILKDSKMVLAFAFPGCEKEVHLQNLRDKFGYISFNADELLRAEVEAGTAEGAAIGAALEILENASTTEDAAESGRGGEGESKTEAELAAEAAEAAEAAAWAAAELRRLLPAIVRREMVSAALLTGVQGFVLADWPKNLEEVNIFEKEIRPCDACVIISAKNEERARERVATTESGENLLTTWEQQGAPLMNYFRRRGKLVELKLGAEGDDDDDDHEDEDDDENVDEDEIDETFEQKQERIFKEAIRQLGVLLNVDLSEPKVDSSEQQPLKDVDVVFVVGGPGSGKGTQCERLKDKFGLIHLSSGDLLRQEVEAGTPLGIEMNEMMKQGKLVPMETVLGLLRSAMEKAVKEGSTGFLIDGYPREVEQGVAFESQVAPCSVCLYYNATDATMTSRLLGRGETSGRADDNEETIKLRLQTFHNQTMPVISFYSDAGKLVEVDAELPPEEVFQRTIRGFEEMRFGERRANFKGGAPSW